MKITVQASADKQILAEILDRRTKNAEIQGAKIEVETEEPEKVERTPGVESFNIDGEKRPGLKGRPVQEEAYARIESKRDAVKALLATTEGYDLRVLNSSRDWDIRSLKKFNPDMKHLKFNSPKEVLGIDKTISEIDENGIERIEIEMPENSEKIELIYREMLT